jgi:glycosyltransferase involved in cell wall biosynthesis
MRILTINHAIPFPPVSGGDQRTYQLVRGLAKRHEVTVVGFGADDDPYVPPPFPVECVRCGWEQPPLYQQMWGADVEAARAARDRLDSSDEPWFVSARESSTFEKTLRRLCRQDFDLALIEHSDMARFLNALPPEMPKILDLVDLHTLMVRREAEEKIGAEWEWLGREAERVRRFESWAASRCALCLAVSGQEAEAARALLGEADVRVVPNGVDTSHFRAASGPGQDGYLLFTGTMNYEPNVEAVQHFVAEIWPLIQRQIPQATFHIVGAYPTPEVEALAGGGVEVHGSVPDMAPYFRQAAVVVVPLLHGGGTRLKILEAAACSRAVVSTPLGAEGLGLANGREVLLADGPDDFADTVVRLLRDPARRRELGRHSRRAAQRYDWQGIGDSLLAIAEEITDRRRAGAGAVAPFGKLETCRHEG